MISHTEHAHGNKQISVSFRKEIIHIFIGQNKTDTPISEHSHLVASLSFVYLQAEVCMHVCMNETSVKSTIISLQ